MDLNGMLLKEHSYQDHGHSGNSFIATGVLDFLEELKRLTQSNCYDPTARNIGGIQDLL